ncbi:phage integrase N-terminal SAM-like domain-containing protein [Methylophilus sp. 'Pure River']
MHWIKRFIFFQQKRHPNFMDTSEIEAFLNRITVSRH